MLIVTFDLRGTPEMAFNEKRLSITAQRHCSRVILRAPGDDIFRLANIGDDRLERKLDASGHTGKPEGCTHDFQEPTARSLVEPFGSALGKFAVQGLLEFGAACEFFERAPVLRAGFLFCVVRR